MKKILLCILFSIVLCSCDWNVDKHHAACNLKEFYSVQYIGHAFGDGHIQFEPDKTDNNSINYAIEVVSPGSQEPSIAIKGVAQCQNGVVSGKFGGGITSKTGLSVLGGKFEGIFNQSDIETPFGRWNIALYDSTKEKNYNLSGYWQEKSITVAVDAAY